MKTMPDRFIECRWSTTRKSIAALGVGQAKDFPASEYFNVKSSVERMNDAYNGIKQWIISGGKNRPYVKRLK